MPVATLVKFVQGASVGTPGVSLIGVTGTGVQVSNGGTNPTPDPGTWVFTVLGVPSASAVLTGVVQSGSTPTWNFTPDVAGTYVVQLEVTDDTTGATSTDVRSFGIYTSLGAPYLIPSFTGNSQSMNFGGQPTGWDKYMEAWLNLVVALASAAVAPFPAVIPIVTGVFGAGTSTPTRAGGLVISLAGFPASLGSLNRHLTFYADIETTTGTAHVQLYDVTASAVVTGTPLTTTALVNTEASAALTVGASPDFVSGDSYEVDVWITGGGSSDRATVTNARIVVTYS
jgi:hypothetical protein